MCVAGMLTAPHWHQWSGLGLRPRALLTALGPRWPRSCTGLREWPLPGPSHGPLALAHLPLGAGSFSSSSSPNPSHLQGLHRCPCPPPQGSPAPVTTQPPTVKWLCLPHCTHCPWKFLEPPPDLSPHKGQLETPTAPDRLRTFDSRQGAHTVVCPRKQQGRCQELPHGRGALPAGGPRAWCGASGRWWGTGRPTVQQGCPGGQRHRHMGRLGMDWDGPCLSLQCLLWRSPSRADAGSCPLCGLLSLVPSLAPRVLGPCDQQKSAWSGPWAVGPGGQPHLS